MMIPMVCRLLAAMVVLLSSACSDPPRPHLCEGITCSHHGRCIVDRVNASCECDDGFVEGDLLTCVPEDGEGWIFIESTTVSETFSMGSPSDEIGRGDDEMRHSVTLTHDFVIRDTEVTFGEFRELMNYVPSGSSLDPLDEADLVRPVDWVSWHEAAAYCNALSDSRFLPRCYLCDLEGDAVICDLETAHTLPQECRGYRLPTEAEWEYAARAETMEATYAGDLDAEQLGCEANAVLNGIAAFCGNADQTRAVSQGEANDWGVEGGLYDMLGNVSEWCHDWYDEYPAGTALDPWGPAEPPDGVSERVFRGGAFSDVAEDVRAARRFHAPPEQIGPGIGLRPVRTLGFSE